MADVPPPPRPRRAPPRAATVVRTERLTPAMVRVVLGGRELRDFPGSEFTDSYVKLTFPRPGITYPQPLDLEVVRATLPAEAWPVVRTYTVRSWDPRTAELTIDFVVHGDEGIAGPWAARAVPGDQVYVAGPGGAYAPDPAADFHLLAGDASALPAIAAALESLPATARGAAFVEVDGPDDRLPTRLPAGVRLHWIHRSGAPVGARLVEAVRAAGVPDGDVQVFAHGEAGFVKELRRWFRVERRLAPSRLSISGYWRVGATEEGWRAAKPEWNREVEELERRAGVA